MGKLSLLFKLVILALFFGLLYVLGVYSPILKQYTAIIMNASSKMVAGTSIVDTSKLSANVPELPSKVKSDIDESVASVKKSGLEVTVGDILGTVGRVTKIVKDFRSVQEFTKEKLEELVR